MNMGTDVIAATVCGRTGTCCRPADAPCTPSPRMSMVAAMDDPLAPRRPIFDARISLATAVHAQPGVYALLLGSGTSTAVGVPTGWGVVTALVAKVAAAAGEAMPTDADIEKWWTEHGDGAPLGYSALL